MSKNTLVILDSNSLLNRAFFALPPMTNPVGQPTGALFGFTTMLFKIMDEIKPDYIAAAFDKSKLNFRHNQYADYKAGRKPMPDELRQQFEPAKELLKAFHIGIFEIEGYEADDIIGTISKRYEGENLEVIIYTGDRDAFQLISQYTRVMFTRKGVTEVDNYTIEALNERYGLPASGIIDLKGLMGDASDNIPGVPGVGEKTALKLLQEYGTVEKVLDNIDKISGKKLKENLENYKEDAIMSKQLATIDRNVPIEAPLENMRLKDSNPVRLRELFTEYGFKSLMNKLKAVSGEVIQESGLPELNMEPDINEIIEKAKNEKKLDFVLVHNNKEPSGIITTGDCFISLDSIQSLEDVLKNEAIAKNTYGGKAAYNMVKRRGMELKGMEFDGEIAAYLLNPSESSYNMGELIYRYAGITVTEDKSNTEQVAALFVKKLPVIKEQMLKEIKRLDMEKLFYDIEMPLVDTLSDMEVNGFKADKKALKDMGDALGKEINTLTSEIYDLAGEEFNINSPKQMGVILFEKLGLPVIKKTKTGYSTDAEVLDELSSQHEIVEKILNYRGLVKLKSTYTDGLISCIGEDGRIHSTFNQTVTATGRISSTDPNLQNIPIKMEQGRRIRKAFIPSSTDYIIMSADYSQIELRVLAHISGDESFIDAFRKGQDIHTRTASEVFGVPLEEVTHKIRSRAKAVNFGIMYGLSDFGLARDLKISRKEAKSYIENYFRRCYKIKEYLDSAVDEGKKNGYVRTLMNRIRYIPEINSSNHNTRNFGERLAMNTPIQGTAADIIKIAMVRVDRMLKQQGFKSKLILQVHDELILEVQRDEIEQVRRLLKEQMEGAVELSVPMNVDINWGENWYEAK
jgi:DNA polymerase-1